MYNSLEEYQNISTMNNDSMQAFELAQKVIVSISCVLSMVGSLLIIIAFIAFKETRSPLRQILTNLSIADLITAFWNLVGILSNFGRYFPHMSHSLSVFCQVQVFFAQYGTNASILWTIWISLHILLSLALKQPTRVNSKLLIVYYLISWVVPAAILVWFAIAGFLEYIPNVTPGWCTITTDKPYTIVLGYTVFVYTAFLVLPVISVVTFCYIKTIQTRIEYNEPHSRSVLRSTELKLSLISVIFIGLRISGLIFDILTFHLHLTDFEKSMIGKILVVFKGIGDSSQGFANSILFVGFTANIRNRFIDCGKKLVRKCCPRVSRVANNRDSTNPTEESPLLNASMRRNDQKYIGNSLMASQELSHDFSPTPPPQLTYEIHTD